MRKEKKALYLVLKKKSFADEIIISLQEEIEKKFNDFLYRIAPNLTYIKLDNKEDGLKYILLKGLINILNDMYKTREIKLTESDKKITNEIFEEEQFKQIKEEIKPQPAYINIQQFPNFYPRYNPYENDKLNQHRTNYSISCKKAKVPTNYYGFI